KGWYLDLPDSRERIVVAPVIFFDKLIVNTYTPASNVCAPGGSSWLMALDPDTGAQFSYPVMDLTGDGSISGADTGAGKKVAPSIGDPSVTFAASDSRAFSLSAANSALFGADNKKCSIGNISQTNVANTSNTNTMIAGACTRTRMAWRQLR
ncbi:MAG: hypothetical protein RLZZ502_904, partial [Pseudomonadota bacterium]